METFELEEGSCSLSVRLYLSLLVQTLCRLVSFPILILRVMETGTGPAVWAVWVIDSSLIPSIYTAGTTAMWGHCSLVPRPRPAFRRLQYDHTNSDGKLGGAWERG